MKISTFTRRKQLEEIKRTALNAIETTFKVYEAKANCPQNFDLTTTNDQVKTFYLSHFMPFKYFESRENINQNSPTQDNVLLIAHVYCIHRR